MKENTYFSERNLKLFFIITLAWTWICGFIPVVLGITGTPVGTFIFYFGGGAPSVVALFLVFFTYPKVARKDYFKRCFTVPKAGWKWILWTILFFIIINLVGILALYIIGIPMPGMDWINLSIASPYLIPVFLLLSLASGPLNEEFGWRGYAQDRLLVKYDPVTVSLILGFIWAIWHLAWYFTPGQAQYDMLQRSIWSALIYIPQVMLLAGVVTFVYIQTNRSILAGALVHMMENLFTSQLLMPYTAEVGDVMRIVKSMFYLGVMIYMLKSKSFKAKAKEQQDMILKDVERFET